ncbi:ABC transporter substrate-binding protein [Vallitalea okinawensis]|uniref:ABC transporter substrate-binding protein n=1 Tax=Vallitalea okinawensis TaxID=2078660 RepID=UPI000CFB8CE0|nr:extracellular solute-binding protein [Vallitalea okinawensis]
MKKIITYLLLGILLVSLLAGCSSKEDNNATSDQMGEKQEESATPKQKEKQKLKIMVLSEDSNRQAIYQNYYSKNIGEAFPNVEAEFELPGSASNYDSKLTVYNASGTLPDIFWGADIVYQSGNALPLTERIKNNGFLDEFTNKAALIPAPDGEIYCLSSGTDSFFAGPIFYNKEIFAKENLELPDSYEGFIELVKKLKEKGYLPISATSWALQNFMFADLMTVDDPNAMRKLQSKEIGFTSEEVVKAAERLSSLYEMGAFPENVTSIEQQVHEQLFIDGDAAMIYHPIWVYPAISVANFEIGYASLPEIFGNYTLNAWGSATAGGFMIAKYTEDPDLALDVAQFLVMQDAEYWANEAGNATALKGFDQLPAGAADVNQYFYEKIRDENTNVIPNFPTNFMQQAQQAEYVTNLEKLIFGQITAEEFGKSMEAIY